MEKGEEEEAWHLVGEDRRRSNSGTVRRWMRIIEEEEGKKEGLSETGVEVVVWLHQEVKDLEQEERLV